MAAACEQAATAARALENDITAKRPTILVHSGLVDEGEASTSGGTGSATLAPSPNLEDKDAGMKMDYRSHVVILGPLDPDEDEDAEIMAHAASFDVADFQQTPSVDRIDFYGVKAPPEEARLAYPVWWQPSDMMGLDSPDICVGIPPPGFASGSSFATPDAAEAVSGEAAQVAPAGPSLDTHAAAQGSDVLVDARASLEGGR